VLPVSAGGMGVAPSRIELSEALRGGEYSRTFYVMNTGDTEVEYALSAEGEVSDWISFCTNSEAREPIERVAVPAEGRTPVSVKFTIPEDAASRTYKAIIVVTSAPPAEGAAQESAGERSGGVAIFLRASAQVTIEVTGTQILAGEVTGILIEDSEVNYPFRATVHFRNTGNVEARPNVSVEIRKGDELVRELSLDEEVVKPGTTEVIRVEGESTGIGDGEYQATVPVSLGDEVIATKEVSFELLPVGTLTRDGKLVSIMTEGELMVGRVLKVLATFANVGQIESPARLVAEVYRDGALIGVEESRELLVLPKERVVLKAYVQLEEPGEYAIKGQVTYGGKLTDVGETVMKVTAPPQPQAAATLPVTEEEQSPGESAVETQPLLFGLQRQTALLVAAIVIGVGFLAVSWLAELRKKRGSKAP